MQFFNFSHNNLDFTILQKIKEAYFLWIKISDNIPKRRQYTLGNRIENKILELLEKSCLAYFSTENKVIKISECIIILDLLKFNTSLSWEAKIIAHKQYEEMSIKLNEIGKMLGGWKNSFNNPERKNHNL